MNPDLDRLITAAEDAYQDACLPNEVLSQRTINAMVCAVLKELREVSPEMAKAGGDKEVPHYWGNDRDDNVKIGSWAAETAFPAMIDHILAEPTAPR